MGRSAHTAGNARVAECVRWKDSRLNRERMPQAEAASGLVRTQSKKPLPRRIGRISRLNVTQAASLRHR